MGHISCFTWSYLLFWDMNVFHCPRPSPCSSHTFKHLSREWIVCVWVKKNRFSSASGQCNEDMRAAISSQTGLPRDTEKQEQKAGRDCNKSSPRNSISLTWMKEDAGVKNWSWPLELYKEMWLQAPWFSSLAFIRTTWKWLRRVLRYTHTHKPTHATQEVWRGIRPNVTNTFQGLLMFWPGDHTLQSTVLDPEK